MFERLSRSWSLIKVSAGVLAKDKELLVFPAVSAVAGLLVVVSFLGPLLWVAAADPEAFDRGEVSPFWLVSAFAFYLVQYLVIFFFNSALVGAASIRLEGGDPTVADGFRIAWSKIDKILGYALIAATVGMILRAIQERAGWIGKWVAGLLGAAWTVATFLVVPILVHRDIGPIDAVKESAAMLKKTWGENLIGQGGVGLVFGLMYVALWVGIGFLAVALAGLGSGVALAVLGALGVLLTIVLALIQAALQGIYAAALYRYATGMPDSGEFDLELLRSAFAQGKR